MKFSVTFQHDAMECGIACLKMICDRYGGKYPLTDIALMCPASAEGVSLLGLSETAEKLGFKTICTRTDVSIFSKAPLPCILHWNQNHFVVLYKVSKGKKFFIADPGKGLIKYDIEEFKKHWISTTADGEEKGIAMFLEPAQAFYSSRMNKGKEQNPRSFRFLFGYIRLRNMRYLWRR